MNRKLLISWFALLLCPMAQVLSQNSTDQEWESVLEVLLSRDEELSYSALEELSVMYESLHSEPLNINTATRDQLRELLFLTDNQIEDIHAYIYMHGPMKTLGELQLTGSLDYDERRLLRQFVYAGDPPVKTDKIKIGDVLKYGRNELICRMDIPLYMRDGFRYHSPEELKRYPNRAYLGSRLSHSIRYTFNWHNRIRFGLCADKDAGEPFAGRNSAGYDFYSPFFFMKDMGFMRELALGNFKVQFGQGLLMGGGFSLGKSMAMTNMLRNTQGLKPHASTQEYGYLNGAGVAMGTGHFTFTLLGAYTDFDATLKGDTVISSFKQDGYHRTELEWSKKHNSHKGTWATNIRYNYRGLKFGGTALYEKLSMPFNGRDRYWGLSTDISLGRPHYALAAELSVADCKPAFICSHTLRLPQSWTVTSLFRAYSPDYSALYSNAPAEGDVKNEIGLLTGFSHSRRGFKVSGYADLFMFPNARNGASERSNGMDLRLETEWRVGRRDELYLTARYKAKEKDCKYTRQLEYCLTSRFRLRWTHNCNSGAELKTQILFSRYDFIAESISNGWALTHSYSRSLIKGQLELNLSCALFFTDSYDSNVSVYESGLRYAYGYMTLYGKGSRMAMTIKWHPINYIQLNLKAGGTWYMDRDEISSSQQRIDACHKEDISVQIIGKF